MAIISQEAGVDLAGPAGEEGDADAAFGEAPLGAAQGTGGFEKLGIVAAFLMVAVVGAEEDEGVVVEAELLEIIEKAGDVAVEAGPGFSGVGGVVSDFDAVTRVAAELVVGVGDGGGEIESGGARLLFAAPVAREFEGRSPSRSMSG